MKRIFMLSVAALLALSACNTVQGLGEDVSAGGEAMTDTAGETQDQM